MFNAETQFEYLYNNLLTSYKTNKRIFDIISLLYIHLLILYLIHIKEDDTYV